MDNKPENENQTPAASNEELNEDITNVDSANRQTGMDSNQDTREGAQAEAPGAKESKPGAPNQGTDAR
ncbi:MAG TPA: hypothetical protein V6C71_22430 [Coleofasciculaceae cyanobacterium]|jgi:hypothetical protein